MLSRGGFSLFCLLRAPLGALCGARGLSLRECESRRLRPARVARFTRVGVDGAGYGVLRYWCWVSQLNRSHVFDWRRENVRCCVRADNIVGYYPRVIVCAPCDVRL